MDTILEFIAPDNVYNIASVIRLFIIMVGIDGVVLTIYSVLQGTK